MARFDHYPDLDDLVTKLGLDAPNTEKAVRASRAHATIDFDGKVGLATGAALIANA